MDRRHKWIVSEKHRFVFYEIQKCATETMRQYFLGTTRKNTTNNEYGARRVSGYNRAKVHQYENAHFFLFSFVRNPWDRIVSCWLSKFVNYHDPAHPDLPGVRDPELSLNTTFEEFVRFVYKTPDTRADCHFKSMHTFLPKGCCIGKVENLQDDFDLIRKRLKLPMYDVPHINKTQKPKRWRNYYTDELKELVGERYKKDVVLYGYRF